MIENLKLHKETYDFILWIFPIIKNFPKSEKFTIGEKIKLTSLNFFNNVVCVLKNYDRKESLKNADLDLEIIRLYLRLAMDLKIISFQRYEVGSRKTDSLGKMIGGILKKTF